MNKRERDGDEGMLVDEGAAAADEAAVIAHFLAAVQAGDVDTVKMHLANDAELVDLEEHETLWTPLHHAVKGAHIGVVRELLKHGADVNALTQHQSTALHIAACNGGAMATPEAVTNFERIVTLLIDRGCPLQAVDNKRNSALHRAAQHGSLGILRTLLLLMGDDGSRNVDGQSVMDRAVAGGHEQVVSLLRQNGAGSSSG
jgi:ankyrin repeat protein